MKRLKLTDEDDNLMGYDAFHSTSTRLHGAISKRADGPTSTRLYSAIPRKDVSFILAPRENIKSQTDFCS